MGWEDRAAQADGRVVTAPGNAVWALWSKGHRAQEYLEWRTPETSGAAQSDNEAPRQRTCKVKEAHDE